MTERTPARSLSASLLGSELDERELRALCRPLPKAKARRLQYLWEFWDPHKGQIPPLGDWRIWLLLAGRGFGKTRTGAEYVRAQIVARRARRIALVAPDRARCTQHHGRGRERAVVHRPVAGAPRIRAVAAPADLEKIWRRRDPVFGRRAEPSARP